MMRVRTLDRYLAREFMRLFVLFIIAAPVLFTIGDITDNLDNYLGRGLELQQVALSYVYQAPVFILWSFPVAGLIATIFTVSTLTRNLEIAAAKAGGISFYRLIAPLPILGVVLTGVALGLSEIVPITNRMRAEVLGERTERRASRTDFVYRTDHGHIYAIRRLDVERGRIYGLFVENEENPPDVPGIHLTAQNAAWAPDSGWTLNNGYLRLFTEEAGEQTIQFERLRPLRFTETPAQLLAEPKDPDEMRYAELDHFIEILQRSGGRPLALMVDKAEKLAIPVATLVIILFGAPLATSSRRGGTAYGVGISLGITITYLMLFKVTGAAGASGALPPVLAAWLPNALFFLAAVVLLARVRT